MAYSDFWEKCSKPPKHTYFAISNSMCFFHPGPENHPPKSNDFITS